MSERANLASFRLHVAYTGADLHPHARAIVDSARRAGVQAFAYTEEVQFSREIVESSLQSARQADMVVVLSAYRYGGAVPADEHGGREGKSLTWLEFEAAVEANRHVAAFIADPAHWPVGHAQLDQMDALERFHAALRARSCNQFTSVEDLRWKFLELLGQFRDALHAKSEASATGAPAAPPRQRTPQPALHVPGHMARPEHIQALHAAVTSRSRRTAPVVGIHGPPRSGKSQVARDVAELSASTFPEGVAYVECGDRAPAVIADILARQAGLALDDPLSSPRETMHRAFWGRRSLIIFDDVVDAEAVRELLPGGAGAALVIARERSQLDALDIASQDQVLVDYMTGDEGLRYLRNMVSRAAVAQDEAAARELVQRAGGMPELLREAAKQIKRMLVDDGQPRFSIYLRQIQARGGFDAARIIDQVVSDLTEEEVRVLAATSVCAPDWILVASLASIVERPVDLVSRSAEILVDRGILVRAGPNGRLGINHLYHAAAAKLARARGWAAGFEAQHARLMVRLASAQPAGKPLEPILLHDVAGVVAAARQMLRTGDYTTAFWLTFARIVEEAPEVHPLVQPARQYVAAVARAGPARDRIAPHLLLHLGRRELLLGRAEAAAERLAQSAAAFEALGEADNLARARSALGAALLAGDRPQEALDVLGRCGDVAATLRDPRERARHHAAIARALWSLGRQSEAIPALEQAVEVERQRDAPQRVARLLKSLARCLAETGRIEPALARLDESIEIARRTNDRIHETHALTERARTLMKAGRFAEAESSLRTAIEVGDDVGDESAAGVARLSLGSCLRGLGRLDEAMAEWEHARATGERLGDSRLVLSALYRLSSGHQARGDTEESVTTQRLAADRLRRSGDWTGALRTLATSVARGRSGEALERDLLELVRVADPLADETGTHRDRMAQLVFAGSTLEANGRAPLAILVFAKAAELAAAAGDARSELVALNCLASAQQRSHRPGEALATIERGLARATEAGDARASLFLRHTRACIHMRLAPAKALAELAELVDMARGAGDRSNEAFVLHTLGTALRRSDPVGAIARLREAVELERRHGTLAGLARPLTTLANMLAESAGDTDTELGEAIEHLDDCLEIERRVGTLRGQALVLYTRGRAHARRAGGLGVDAALADFERAEALARRAGDDETLMRALKTRAVLLRRLRQYDQSLACLWESLRLGEARGNDHHVALVLRELARSVRTTEEMEAIREAHHARRQAAEAAGDFATLTRLSLGLGMVHRERGEYAMSRAALREAVVSATALADRRGDRSMLIEALRTLGDLEQAAAEFGDADAAYEQAARVAEQEGFVVDAARAQLARARCARASGDAEGAVALLRKVMDHDSARLPEAVRREASEELVDVLDQLGRTSDILAHLEARLSSCEAAGDEPGAAAALLTLSATSNRLGHVDAALDWSERAILRARQAQIPLLEADALVERAFALRERRSIEEAADALQQAIHIKEELGDDSADRLRDPLVRLLRRSGRLEAAERALRGQIEEDRKASKTLSHVRHSRDLARLLIDLERPSEAATLLQNLLHEVICSDAGLRCSVHLTLGQAMLRAGADPRLAIEQFTLAQSAGDASGDPAVVPLRIRAMREEAICHLRLRSEEGLARGIELLQQALERSGEIDDAEGVFHARLRLGPALLSADRLDEAIECMTAALGSVEGRRQAWLERDLGRAYRRGGMLSLAADRYMRAAQLEGMHGESGARAEVLCELAELRLEQRLVAEGIRVAREAAETCGSGDSDARIRALSILGRCQRAACLYSEALESLGAARDMATRRGNIRGTMNAMISRAAVLTSRGERGDAGLRELAAAEALLPRLDARAAASERIKILNTKSLALMLAQRPAEALEAIELSLTLAGQQRDGRNEAFARNTRGEILRCMGRFDEALAEFGRCAEWFERDRHLRSLAIVHGRMARTHLGRGDPDSAMASARTSLSHADASGAVELAGAAWLVLGCAQTQRGHRAEAIESLRRASACAAESGDPRLRDGALGRLAAGLREAGQLDEAASCAQALVKVQAELAARGIARRDVLDLDA